MCDLSSALVISCFFCGRTSGWVKGEGRNFKVSSPFIICGTASDCTENSVDGISLHGYQNNVLDCGDLLSCGAV